MIERFADLMQVAFMPFQWLSDPGNLGELGFPRSGLCCNGRTNHQGPFEIQHDGRFLTKLVP